MAKAPKWNLDSDEQIIDSIEFCKIFIVRDILLFWLIIPIFLFFKDVLKVCTAKLEFTNKRIIGKVGWIKTRIMDTPLNKINNVVVSSNFWGKVFHYQTISIESIAGNYCFTGTKNAVQFGTGLLHAIEQSKKDEMEYQAKYQAQYIADALKTSLTQS